MTTCMLAWAYRLILPLRTGQCVRALFFLRAQFSVGQCISPCQQPDVVKRTTLARAAIAPCTQDSDCTGAFADMTCQDASGLTGCELPTCDDSAGFANVSGRLTYAQGFLLLAWHQREPPLACVFQNCLCALPLFAVHLHPMHQDLPPSHPHPCLRQVR